MRIGMGQIAPIFPGGDTDLSTGVTVSGYTVGTPSAAQAASAEAQYSAGIQDALSVLPLTGGPDDLNVYALPSAPTSPPPATTTPNWGMIAAIVAGAGVFIMVVKK